MIDLAKKNNPTATYYVMDCRNLEILNTKFNGIICGFCIPYLSGNDLRKLLRDCFSLLHTNGILYISFVEGDYKESGYQYGSTGNKTYFYYFSKVELLQLLETNGFSIMYSGDQNYGQSNDLLDTHIILIAKKEK